MYLPAISKFFLCLCLHGNIGQEEGNEHWLSGGQEGVRGKERNQKSRTHSHHDILELSVSGKSSHGDPGSEEIG